MKVRVSMSSISAILFALILCQFAKALEHVDLALCDETADSVPLCIVHDSMGEKQLYLHANATLSLLIKLPVSVLTELWGDYSKIEIVTSSGVAINNGQELIRSDDRDRWTIEFNFQRVNRDFGKLNIVLHVKHVEYIDEQYLHLEITTEDNVFVTREKIWIPVQVTNPDHEGQAPTTDNPAEDPSAILQARIETLQNEKEALQLNLTTTQNIMNQYQMKYFHCLESKEELINGTVKPKLNVPVYGKGQKGLNITTVVVLLFAAVVITVFMIHCSPYKPTEYNVTENGGISPQSAVTFKDLKDFEELFCTVQSTTPEDAETAQRTCSSQ